MKLKKIMTHILILFIVLASTLVICNFTEDMSLNLINTANPFPEEKTSTTINIIDADGIPIVDYGYINGKYVGRQRNPVVISQKAFSYYENYKKGDVKSKILFLNCANSLVDNSIDYGNYSILEYHFLFEKYGMTDPWRSGMAQGQAIQVLVKAH